MEKRRLAILAKPIAIGRMPWPAGDAAIAVARGRKFPAIPIEAGIFAIVLEKCRFGTAKCEVDQPFAGQFPLSAKREFFSV